MIICSEQYVWFQELACLCLCPVWMSVHCLLKSGPRMGLPGLSATSLHMLEAGCAHTRTCIWSNQQAGRSSWWWLDLYTCYSHRSQVVCFRSSVPDTDHRQRHRNWACYRHITRWWFGSWTYVYYWCIFVSLLRWSSEKTNILRILLDRSVDWLYFMQVVPLRICLRV